MPFTTDVNKKLVRRWDSERELFYDIVHVLQPTIKFTSLMESTHVHSCQMRLLQSRISLCMCGHRRGHCWSF